MRALIVIAVALIGVAAAGPQGGFSGGGGPGMGTVIACGSATSQTFTAAVSVEAENADPIIAAMLANILLMATLVDRAYVSCTACVYGPPCFTSVTDMSDPMQSSTLEGPPGNWECTASYSGTYRVSCSECDKA